MPEGREDDESDAARGPAGSIRSVLEPVARGGAADVLRWAGERSAQWVEGSSKTANSEPGPKVSTRVAAAVSLILAVIGLLGVVAQQSSTTKSVWLLVMLVAVAVALLLIWLVVAFPRTRSRRREPGRPAAEQVDEISRSPRVQAYVEQVERAYQGGHGQREWLITAPLGYGKTSVMNALAARFRERGALVARITIPASSGFVVDRTCLYLVDMIANDMRESPNHGRRLKEAVAKATTRIADEASSAAALDELSETVSEMLSGTGREVVLLIDDFHHITESGAVDWLLALGRAVIAKGPGLVVLASQEPSDVVPDGRLALAAISGRQSAAEAHWRLAGTGKAASRLPVVAQAILKASGGMCFAFDWLCRQVAVEGIEVLDSIISEQPIDRRVDQAATAALDQLDRDAAAIAGVESLRLADWLAVLDRFGGTYLTTVLEEILEEEEGLSADQAAEILAWLRDRHHEIQPFDDDPELGLRLVPFLQEFRRDKLRQTDPRRLQSLRAVVERKYWRHIDADLTEPAADQLVAMVRFETPQWHALTMEWLDHAQGAGTKAARDVTRSCVQLFLGSYTWWDAFVPSPYCTQMLEEYERRWASALWIADLRNFYENYLSGSYSPRRRPADESGRWAKAETALVSLTDRLGKMPSDVAEQRVYGLIALMRADVCRFRGLHDEAINWLDRAQVMNPEEWLVTWIAFRRAEVHFENGQYAQARALAEVIERELVEMKDNDMTILVAQLISDLDWAEGDAGRSITYLARAVLWAHAYHLQQECDGTTNPSTPNAYTQQRHQEAHERLLERLVQLDRQAKADVTARISALFAPYWKHVRQTRPGRGEILPPRPSLDDIYQGSESAYFHDVREMYFDSSRLPPRTMRDRLTEPLGAALP